MLCSSSLPSLGITFKSLAEQPHDTSNPEPLVGKGKGGGKCELFAIFFNNISPADMPLFVTITLLTQPLNWILFSNL